MKNNKLLLYFIVILILLTSGGVILLAFQNQKLSELLKFSEPLKIGDKAYLFQRKDINGKKISIKAYNVLLIFLVLLPMLAEATISSIQSALVFEILNIHIVSGFLI